MPESREDRIARLDDDPESANSTRDGIEETNDDDVVGGEPLLGRRLLQPRTLVSFLLAAAIVFFVFRKLDIPLSDVKRQLREANPFLYLVALATYYFAVLLRSWRWQLMLDRVGINDRHGYKHPSLYSTFEMVVLSLFVNCVVPARLGDAYRGYLLKQRSGASFGVGLGTILAERLIDVVMMVAVVVVAGIAVFGTHVPGRAEQAFLLGMVTVVIGIIGSIVLYFFRDHIEERIPERFTGHFRRVNKGIFEILERPLPFAGIGLVIWVLDGIRVLTVARALGVELSLQEATVVSLLSALVTIVPFTPAGLGVVESFMIWMLVQVDVIESSAAAIAVLDRTITYFSLLVVGLPLYIVHMKREAAVLKEQTASTPSESGATP